MSDIKFLKVSFYSLKTIFMLIYFFLLGSFLVRFSFLFTSIFIFMLFKIYKNSILFYKITLSIMFLFFFISLITYFNSDDIYYIEYGYSWRDVYGDDDNRVFTVIYSFLFIITSVFYYFGMKYLKEKNNIKREVIEIKDIVEGDDEN